MFSVCDIWWKLIFQHVSVDLYLCFSKCTGLYIIVYDICDVLDLAEAAFCQKY